MTNENNLPLTFCRLLCKAKKGEKILQSKFSSKVNQEFLKAFCDENILQITVNSRAKYVYCPNSDYLNSYLKSLGINNLNNHIAFLQDNERNTRAEAAQITGDSKRKSKRVFNGFFINTYLPLSGKIKGETISLEAVSGTWIYIQDYKKLHIDKNITIVGIENTETFALIKNYQHLFEHIKPLFLLRYNNNSYIEWLQNIENDYLHFGDFDLSGIAIYISNFRNKLPEERCNFFVPPNIEILIKNSNNSRDYLKQQNDNSVKGIDFDDYSEISSLAKLIHKEQKTIEQEVLMKFK